MKITDAMIDGAVLGDKAMQWKVCKGMQGAIKKLANSFCKQRPDLDIDDLLQEGYIVVLRCCDGYVKKDRKALFSTYAFRAILNSFIRFSDRAWRQRMYSPWQGKYVASSEENEPGMMVEDGMAHEDSDGNTTEPGESAEARSREALDEMLGLGFTEREIHVMMARDGGRLGDKALLTFEQIGEILGISKKASQEAYESAIMKREKLNEDLAG